MDWIHFRFQNSVYSEQSDIWLIIQVHESVIILIKIYSYICKLLFGFKIKQYINLLLF